MKNTSQVFSQPYLLLTFTALFWGGNAIAGKMAVGHVSPFLLTCLRWLVAIAIILPFAFPYLKRDWPLMRPKLGFMCLLGAVGYTVFNNLMYLSLNYTSAINVAIVQASMPLIVFLLNFLIFKIGITWPQIIGFGITAIGVIAITSRGSLDIIASLAFNNGDILMIAAIMTYGIYSVFLKNLPKIHWLSFIAVLGTSAFAASIFFALWEFGTSNIIYPDLQGWLVILFTAIFPAILAQVFWRHGLEAIGSNRGGVFVNLVPIFGSLLAILILGENFHLYHAIGLALVLFGVWLSQR